MLKKRLIYGNGSMAKVYCSYLRNVVELCGFIVDDCCIDKNNDEFCSLPLVPLSKAKKIFNPRLYDITVAVGYREMNELRKQKTNDLKNRGYSIAGYIDTHFILHDDVAIGEGCVILENVSIHPGSRIGDGVFIAGNNNIGHDCFINDYCWINGGVSIAGGTTVGECSFLGVNSTLTNGITIGKKNFISAGAIINRNTDNDAVYLSESAVKFKLNSNKFLTFTQNIHQQN